MNPAERRQARIAGMLVGHLTGDALGSAYEFRPRFGAHDPNPVMAKGVFGHPKGAGTDDSEMTRCAALTVIETGGSFDAALYAQKLAAWKETGPRDIGGQTSRGIRAWVATGKAPRPDEHAQGNGALMACSPLAAILDRDEAIVAARSLAMATHPSDTAVECCALYVSWLWDIIQGLPRAEPMPRTLLSATDGWEADGPNIGWCAGSLSLADSALADALETDDPAGQLVRVVRAGGDTDTNAAISGALLGAQFGLAPLAELSSPLLRSDRSFNEGLAEQLAAL